MKKIVGLYTYIVRFHQKSYNISTQMGTNPMNEDTRNQGLVGMADGIPLFRDKHSRSCIPVMLRTANMGDHLSKKFRYTHLAALVPSHYWNIGETS